MLKFFCDYMGYMALFAAFVWYENSSYATRDLEINKERGALSNYANMFTCVEHCIKHSLQQYTIEHERQLFRFDCIKPCYKNVFLPNIVHLE